MPQDEPVTTTTVDTPVATATDTDTDTDTTVPPFTTRIELPEVTWAPDDGTAITEDGTADDGMVTIDQEGTVAVDTAAVNDGTVAQDIADATDVGTADDGRVIIAIDGGDLVGGKNPGLP
jgi:biopolymer transport protein ExbD